MKEKCDNCIDYTSKKRWREDEYVIHYCLHKDLHHKVKGVHIYSGLEEEYHKTNRLIESVYITLQTKPPWCPGFREKPQEMPKEMADKIFGSDDDENN